MGKRPPPAPVRPSKAFGYKGKKRQQPKVKQPPGLFPVRPNIDSTTVDVKYIQAAKAAGLLMVPDNTRVARMDQQLYNDTVNNRQITAENQNPGIGKGKGKGIFHLDHDSLLRLQQPLTYAAETTTRKNLPYRVCCLEKGVFT